MYLANAQMNMPVGATGSKPGGSTADDVGADPQMPPRIMYWMTSFYLSAFMLFLFWLVMLNFGVNMLGSVQVPQYQLPANEEKNKDNNRDWYAIWGNIE